VKNAHPIPEALIKATDISRHYTMADGTVQALDNVDLTVNKGEFIAITGPSGAGKSTLMNILGLLDTCDSGTYMFSGLDTKMLSDSELSRIRNQKIGFVFQAFNLIPTLSVLENVALPLNYRGMPSAKRIARSKAALEAVGLSARLSHKPYELSGGQQQRVAIARAIAADPELILADEPCGSLDSRSSKEVMELLRSRHECGKTVILITHDLDDAAYADRILTVCDGKLYK
jgi:putative ABC transport system ATP-binding protein